MLPLLAFELPAFLLGLLFGSFLNVCISRLPDHRSISKPRSHCPQCLATIRWYDNVPLLSWILLAAKCRRCKAAIPWRYPLVELGVGFWFVAIFTLAFRASLVGMYVQLTQSDWVNIAINALSLAILGFLLIGLLVMDWQTHILPDAFTLTGTAIGFSLVCVQAIFLAPGQYDIHLNTRNNLRMSSPGSSTGTGNVFLTGAEHLVFGRLLAVIAAALILLAIRAIYKAVRHREGLGLGDVKLLAMIAAFLGFWPAVLALFVGCILASIYAVALLARRRANAVTQLPLGAFLSIGGLFAALFGVPLIAWYTNLL